MNPGNPPRIATWMMQHLSPARCDEALAGDLFEEYRAGRSVGWYWLQVVAALAVAWSRSVWQRRAPLLFAAIWSFISPAWMLLYLRHFGNGRLDDVMWRIPFPWSTVCAFVLGAARDVLFVWLGVLVYVVLCRIAFGNLHLRRFARAFLSSFLAYAIAGSCVIAIALTVGPHSNGPAVDWRTLTLIEALENLRPLTIFFDFPFFIGTAGALWSLSSEPETTASLVA